MKEYFFVLKNQNIFCDNHSPSGTKKRDFPFAAKARLKYGQQYRLRQKAISKEAKRQKRDVDGKLIINNQ